MAELDRTRVTYRYERVRALSAGILESAATVFLLLIAVRRFEAGPFAKAMVAGGGSLGLLLAPWIVSRVKRSGLTSTQAASRIATVGCISFLVIALVPVLPVYVVGCILATASSSAMIPLLTQMYQENYPEHRRGQLFARTIMVRIAASAVCSHFAGRLLDEHIGYFQWLLLVFAAAAGLASFCLSRCPSGRLPPDDGAHPFIALRYVKHDRLFRQTLIAWMFLGFAMLMISPLRIEYLANPRYGVTWNGQVLTATVVALLTGVIPNIARLVLNPVWGWLFDRMNFFVLRLMLNLAIIGGILSFFATGSAAGLVTGAVLFGIASAGADLAWSLWVTKFAPAERVADYMSVHTFFTGLRGVVAPVVAFQVVAGIGPMLLGFISVGLIAVGSAFLLPEIRYGKRARPATALVEEVSD